MTGTIAYYAFGGGAGHVCRSVAILRQLQRLVHVKVVALTNSCFAHLYALEGLPYRHAGEMADEPSRLAAWLEQTLRDVGAEVLVVDALPRGLFGELPALLPRLPMAKAFVGRYLNRRYLDSFGVLEHVDAHYDLAIFCEPWPDERHRGLAVDTVEVEPILIRDAGELPTRSQARARLSARGDVPLVLAVAAHGSDADPLLPVLAKIQRRGRAPAFDLGSATLEQAQTPSLFPLIEALPGADVVVGASGYNLWHECAATRTPAIFLPQKRLYDDQFWRARHSCVARSPDELEDRLAAALSSRPERPAKTVAFPNGAHAAAEAIMRLAQTSPYASVSAKHTQGAIDATG